MGLSKNRKSFSLDKLLSSCAKRNMSKARKGIRVETFDF